MEEVVITVFSEARVGAVQLNFVLGEFSKDEVITLLEDVRVGAV